MCCGINGLPVCTMYHCLPGNLIATVFFWQHYYFWKHVACRRHINNDDCRLPAVRKKQVGKSKMGGGCGTALFWVERFSDFSADTFFTKMKSTMLINGRAIHDTFNLDTILDAHKSIIKLIYLAKVNIKSLYFRSFRSWILVHFGNRTHFNYPTVHIVFDDFVTFENCWALGKGKRPVPGRKYWQYSHKLPSSSFSCTHQSHHRHVVWSWLQTSSYPSLVGLFHRIMFRWRCW